MHKLTAFLAAVLVAPTLAAAPPAGLDRAGLVQVKDTKEPAARKPVAKAGKQATGKQAAGKQAAGKQADKDEADFPARRLADFGKEKAPWDVVHLANWVTYTRNSGPYAFIIIDKRDAHVYVFNPEGKLRSSSPILLGKFIGDDTAPGVANKTLAQLKEHEKTTPAGRFPARPGVNSDGEDVIWIDYDAAVSMHRLRPVDPRERREHRMATPTKADNRISNGCVNVPPKFYDAVLKPTVDKYGAYVYVLPETKPPQALFASFDVPQDDEDEARMVKASAKAEKADR